MSDLPLRMRDWPDDARELYEERAAIRHEANRRMTRTEAERLARQDVIEEWRRRACQKKAKK